MLKRSAAISTIADPAPRHKVSDVQLFVVFFVAGLILFGSAAAYWRLAMAPAAATEVQSGTGDDSAPASDTGSSGTPDDSSSTATPAAPTLDDLNKQPDESQAAKPAAPTQPVN